MTDYLTELEKFHEVIKKLRDPQHGCPWDKKQNHQSLKKYMLEESYEFVEAVCENDPVKMEEELGDVLLQILLHADEGERQKSFTLASIMSNIKNKMIRRHPHVFGDTKASSINEVWQNWEEIKGKEKKITDKTDLLTNVPKNLPALMRSEKLQKIAARVGFDWENVEEALPKVEEEVEEFKEIIHTKNKPKITEELGDLLFSLVNIARKLDIDPEDALQVSNKKFIKRFSYIEKSLKKQNKTLQETSLAEMDKLWKNSKNKES